MDLYKRRDLVLAKLFEYSEESPAPSTLANWLDIPEIDWEIVEADYKWLYDNDLLTNDARPSLTAIGVNYVEQGASVRELAQQAVRKHTQHVQNNTNYAPAVNVQGDHADVSQVNNQVIEDFLDEAIGVLGEEDPSRARELELTRERSGVKESLRQLGQWMKDRLLSEAVLAALVSSTGAMLAGM